METLATSTKTVSVPLGPRTSDAHEDQVEGVGSQSAWQRSSIPGVAWFCSQGGGLWVGKMRLGIIVYMAGSVPAVVRPLVALGYRKL